MSIPPAPDTAQRHKAASDGTGSDQALNNSALGIGFILAGMMVISVQDVMIKQLSGDYPLHQIIFARATIGLTFSLGFLWWEGGVRVLKTDTPFLHLVRALLVVVANMSYFAALAVLPLAEATALFFVAPLFITLLSVPLLGEKVGPRRIVAILVGFCGVVIMTIPAFLQSGGAASGEMDSAGPWSGGFWLAQAESGMSIVTALLPVCAALCYALMQILTRRLGLKAKASAMAIYIQVTFVIVSSLFFLVAGDGRHAEGSDNASVNFLLRAWQWPAEGDTILFAGCGVASAIIGYSLAQAYRVANAATVAPFEYIALPLAILWGWLIWGDLPNAWTMAGIVLIIGAGFYVFLREKMRGKTISRKRPLRRW